MKIVKIKLILDRMTLANWAPQLLRTTAKRELVGILDLWPDHRVWKISDVCHVLAIIRIDTHGRTHWKSITESDNGCSSKGCKEESETFWKKHPDVFKFEATPE